MNKMAFPVLAASMLVACSSDSPTNPNDPPDPPPNGLTGSWDYAAAIEWVAAGENVACDIPATLDLLQDGSDLTGDFNGQVTCETGAWGYDGIEYWIDPSLWPSECQRAERDLEEEMARRGLLHSSIHATEMRNLAEECGMLVVQQIASLTANTITGDTQPSGAITFFAGALRHDGDATGDRLSGTAVLLHPSDPTFVLAEGIWTAESQQTP